MTEVIISKSIADDFKNADFYRKRMSFDDACRLMDDRKSLFDYFEYALKRGWTKEKTVSDYVDKEHGAIFTAAFLIVNRL